MTARRKVEALHFYGHAGDPGFTGGPCTERVFYGREAWELAVAFAADRMRRPIIDDPHPGRVLVRDVTKVQPRQVDQFLWVGPDVEVRGGFTFQWREPQVFGWAS